MEISNYIAPEKFILPSPRGTVPLGWQHLIIVDRIRYLTTSNLDHSGDIRKDSVFSQRAPLAQETRCAASPPWLDVLIGILNGGRLQEVIRIFFSSL
jgi:hypothetical protein